MVVMRPVVWLIPLLALLALPLALGHDPSFGNARIGDSAKSWAVYASLPPDGTGVHVIHAEAGQRLTIDVYTPAAVAWVPDARLEGPGVATVPASVLPVPRISFEPFAPQALRFVSSLAFVAPVSGDYALVITGAGGPYGFSVGEREAFSAADWLFLPWRIHETHVWDGQPAWLLFAPIAVGAAAGAWRGRSLARGGAGALVGSAVVVMGELVLAVARAGLDAGVLVTLGFVVAQLAAAALAWRARGRALLVVAAVLGVLAWGGLVVGPAAILLDAFLPRSAPVSSPFRRAGRTR